jgi:hypothetical protein
MNQNSKCLIKLRKNRGLSFKHVRGIRKRRNYNNSSQTQTSKRMGTTTGWRRNTSCELAREEEDNDGATE